MGGGGERVGRGKGGGRGRGLKNIDNLGFGIRTW